MYILLFLTDCVPEIHKTGVHQSGNYMLWTIMYKPLIYGTIRNQATLSFIAYVPHNRVHLQWFSLIWDHEVSFITVYLFFICVFYPMFNVHAILSFITDMSLIIEKIRTDFPYYWHQTSVSHPRFTVHEWTFYIFRFSTQSLPGVSRNGCAVYGTVALPTV